MRYDILGTGFDRVSMEEAVEAAGVMLRSGSGGYICTPNPEIVWMARKDRTLARSIAEASLVLPDGIGIIWASARCGIAFRERVAGCDFLFELLKKYPCRIYILGGKPGVAEKAANNLVNQYPLAEVVGFSDGYYSDEAKVVSAIRACHPELLLVCMGAPKQEIFMNAYHKQISGCVMIGLGGTVDILAGTEKRAPLIIRRMRMEWLYRLIMHPSRISRQIALPKFVFTVLIQSRRKRKVLCTDKIH